MKEGLNRFLFKQKDIAPLVVFRIGIGLLMAAEGFGAILTGWVSDVFVEPAFTFNFIGFDFLQVIVGPQAYLIYFLLGVFGLLVALGWYYRLAVFCYLILWSSVYFAQKSAYNNHYYLLILVVFLLLWVPANRYYSLDLKFGRAIRSLTVSHWCIFIFKFLLAIVYFYAAIAKIYPDWLNAHPVDYWMMNKSDYFIIGPLLAQPWFAWVIAYGGIVFDFFIIPALWWKKTRRPAFIVAIFFHLFNSIIFQIGIFPYMMLIFTVLYFDERKVRRLFFRNEPELNYEAEVVLPARKNRYIAGTILGLFFALQIALPTRHYFYPGLVHWTEEGHRLSWHMMLRSKSGNLQYVVKDKSNKLNTIVFPEKELSPKQARSLASRPDMIWQYAQRLKSKYENEGYEDVEVYARSRATLNGRPWQNFIDPEVNLADVEWKRFEHSEWILPLKETKKN